MQTALASLFTVKYGSIIIMDTINYAQALPLFGLRQNIYTDPQRPMRIEPGVYPLNGADENAPCAVTVDFALTYFIVSGELERSGVPVNLLISDAGGYSVLTAWAAGKFSASSIAKFIRENNIEGKIKNRNLLIPGKVAVLKGELERSGVPVNLLISDAGGYSVLTAWAAGKFSAASIAKFIRENNIEGKIKNRNLLIPGKVAVLKGELEENLPGWKIIVAPNDAVSLVKFMKELKWENS
jgi:CO dehydrogenase/acetyl-CoA synthase gamma subunit (corrinoid Fe-S protein)